MLGQAVAERLHATGHHLSAYNRTPEKTRTLQQQGIHIASTAVEAIAAADVVILLLADATADERRVLVTNHDSLAYFADRYDLTVIGTVIPSMSTVAETDAAALAELSDVIDEHDVPAIFSGELESSADAEALAGRLGVAIVPIPTDSLTTGGDASTYVDLMRSNATTIAAALSAP